MTQLTLTITWILLIYRYMKSVKFSSGSGCIQPLINISNWSLCFSWHSFVFFLDVSLIFSSSIPIGGRNLLMYYLRLTTSYFGNNCRKKASFLSVPTKVLDNFHWFTVGHRTIFEPVIVVRNMGISDWWSPIHIPPLV